MSPVHDPRWQPKLPRIRFNLGCATILRCHDTAHEAVKANTHHRAEGCKLRGLEPSPKIVDAKSRGRCRTSNIFATDLEILQTTALLPQDIAQTRQIVYRLSILDGTVGREEPIAQLASYQAEMDQ